MGNKPIKFDKDEPEILERFYNKVKETLVNAYHYKSEEADFETYKWILQNPQQEKQPQEFFKIFSSIPKKSRAAIIKYLGYKTENEFKKSFSKNLNKYRQNILRRDEQSKEGETE